MLVYRVFPYLPAASDGEQGHPQYQHPQGSGRLDNPHSYFVWYFSMDPQGAIGEVFADLTMWDDDMFIFPKLAGSRRALGVYSLPDNCPLLDLDDAGNLLDRGLRPTQVIERNRPSTASWARKIWEEQNFAGDRKWEGVRWWSYHRPVWRIVGYWGASNPVCEEVRELSVSDMYVKDAARILNRPIGSV